MQKSPNGCRYMDWDNITDAPELSFENQKIEAKVVSVYDGDTIKIVFPLHDTFYKWNCRLTGVDTPEIRTRCKEEKELSYKVRDCLRDKIFDKYGRLLIEIMCIGETCSVNDWLIQNDYAFAYDGGTKKSWKEFLENKGNHPL